MTDLVILDKIRVTLTNWDFTQSLGNGYVGVMASNIRWMQYTTASTNNNEIIIKIEELGSAGTKWLDQNANTKYFLSYPLDQATQVTCGYANFTEQIDKQYLFPISVNSLHFQVFINGIPATDVSPTNPIQIEIILYKNKIKTT